MHKRCKTMAYDMHKSDSNKILSKASSKLTYGSAKLQGFIWLRLRMHLAVEGFIWASRLQDVAEI